MEHWLYHRGLALILAMLGDLKEDTDGSHAPTMERRRWTRNRAPDLHINTCTEVCRAAPHRKGPHRTWGKGAVFITKGPVEGWGGTCWEFRSHQNLLSTYYVTGTAAGLRGHGKQNEGPTLLRRTGKAEQAEGRCGALPHSSRVS